MSIALSAPDRMLPRKGPHPVERLLDVVDPERVLADEVFAELVDHRRSGIGEAPRARLADAGEARVRRDPDHVVGPDEVASDEETLDLFDLHAAALAQSASGRWGRPSRVGNHSSPRSGLGILVSEPRRKRHQPPKPGSARTMPAIRRASAELILDARAVHGEGPAWDAASGRLLWVDMMGERLHLTTPGTDDEVVGYTQPVCVAVPRASGGMALALGDGIWLQDRDGTLHQVLAIPQPDPPAGAVRMNDGKCDPAGRFWAGSMAYDARHGSGVALPSRSRRDDARDRARRDDLERAGVDARRRHDAVHRYADPAGGRVRHGPVSGDIANRRPLVEIPAAAGMPDGMTIDDEGSLWIALWEGGAVHRYTPDGRLDTRDRPALHQCHQLLFRRGGPRRAVHHDLDARVVR